MSRSLVPSGGNDRIYTPDDLAVAIVTHFKPYGRCLEPCAGDGAFIRALECSADIECVDWCEIDKGSDFLLMGVPERKYTFIVTNCPWSQFLAFLKRSMQFADNIVFLGYANAWFVKSRINAMEAAGFHFREFAYVANPKKPWPQMGLQMAAVHISREPGNCKFSRIDWKP